MSESREGAPLFPLHVEGLGFESRGRRLIDGLELKLEAAGQVALLGPNGAGKSLLLRLLHGLLTPTAGRIHWGRVGAPEQARSRQAMVFQQPVLLRRSVQSNLRFALKVQGVSGKELKKQVAHWLARAGLEGLAARPARVLSGGEQQRLALARALLSRPDVLLMDEPTASLDPASVGPIEQLIREAQAAGTKSILVSHDFAQVRRLADQVVFLDRGKVVECAAVDDFLRAPSSAAARAYVEGRLPEGLRRQADLA